MSIKLSLEKYRTRRAFSSPWSITGLRKAGLSGAVVIPALAESSNLAATLESLSQNPGDLLNRFLVVVVVNHREDAALEDKADNLATLSMLPELADRLPMNVGWIDAASPGLELTVRDGGVGMARKLGFDLALPHLAWHGRSPILVALDGDTLVEPNYLASIIDHFEHSQCGGAVIPFHHRQARTQTEQDIINRYELFLRSYVFGLDLAGSPYAFHTVGSAMACTGSAYLRAGGMNTRRAAEDFYFLQQLKKTSGVGQVKGTVVYPSSRPSHRVPFGTGRSVAKALASEEGATTFYRPECYRLLGVWLSLAASSFGLPGGEVMQAAEGISSTLARFLNEEGFLSAWERISLVKRTPDTFLPAFHEWFDALRTMKLIHGFSAEDFPRCTPEVALPPLLEMGGHEPVAGITAQLELLRNLQQVR